MNPIIQAGSPRTRLYGKHVHALRQAKVNMVWKLRDGEYSHKIPEVKRKSSDCDLMKICPRCDETLSILEESEYSQERCKFCGVINDWSKLNNKSPTASPYTVLQIV
jgi:hypothetical protein